MQCLISESESEVVDKEIQALIDKRDLEPVGHEQGEFVSNVFLVPKKEAGRFRLCV